MSVIKTTLPLAPEDTKWSASEAIKSVKEWASDSDGNIDWSKYRKAFFFVDDDNDDDDSGGEAQGDYKLPFAMVIDGKLQAVWNGVSGCMAALNGARGGVDLGDDDDEREAIYKQICVYYKKFEKDPPEMAKSMKREVGERVDAVCMLEPDSVKDLGEGVFEAVITTSAQDRMGESIDTSGITTDSWEQTGMPVLYGHDYSGLPIGKAISFKQFKNKMMARFQLAVDILPFAQTVADMIKAGYLNAVSIGGVVRQWNENYTVIEEMEMVEFSVVPIPANPNALITSRSLEKATGKTVEEISREFQDAVAKSVGDKVKSLDNDGLTRHIKTLEELLTILKAAKESSEKTSREGDDQAIRLTVRKAGGQISQTGQEIIKLVKRKES